MNYKHCALLCLLNIPIAAEKSLMLGGWVPYWRADSAVTATKIYWDMLDQISPFSLEVDEHGTIKNPFRGRARLWQDVQDRAKKEKKLFVPTIFWTKTGNMHNIFSNKAKRDDHIRQIMDMVLKNNFDGININYEKVSGDSREAYLQFLQKLAQELHSRGLVLYTSIGGRTGDNTIGVLGPGDYARIHKLKPIQKNRINHKAIDNEKGKKLVTSLNPGTGETAARYKKIIEQCCDQIHVMGYDEWGKPYKRSKDHLKNNYFMSHASNQWIEQILQYLLTFVPSHKIVLGVPTYGLEYAILHRHDGDKYTKKRRNVKYYEALKLAETHKVKPLRTAGGELSFMYKTDHEQRYVCFLDAQSIKDKIDLAKKYGIKGLYLFTINGEMDKSLLPLLHKELQKK